MIEFLVNAPAVALREADEILARSRAREGWWGPARSAYDEMVDGLRSRLAVLCASVERLG